MFMKLNGKSQIEAIQAKNMLSIFPKGESYAGKNGYMG